MKPESQFNTPVVVIIFNRPDKALQLRDEIAHLRPAKLFVVADGPRPGVESDLALCAEAREVFHGLDWHCSVTRIYADSNMGCRDRILTGLDTVFGQVEKAIILEDDCQPAPSFFEFASTMLREFENDGSVAMVSGNNFGFQKRKSDRVIMHNHALIWGWGTWANRWQQFRATTIGNALSVGKGERALLAVKLLPNFFRLLLLVTLKKHGDSAWDAFWATWVVIAGKRVLSPGVNLVANTGFGQDSTHTSMWVPDVSIPPREVSFPLRINKNVLGQRLRYDLSELSARGVRWSAYAARHPVQFFSKVSTFVSNLIR